MDDMDLSGWGLRDAIRRYIEDGWASEDPTMFDHLFTALATWQYQNSEILGRYHRSFVYPGGKIEWTSHKDIPPLPVRMFKQFEIRSYAPHADEKVWRSSGTSGLQSQHFLANTTLYDVVIKKLWRQHVPEFSGLTYKLIPHPDTWPDSSLAHFFGVGEMSEGRFVACPWLYGVSDVGKHTRNFDLALKTLINAFEFHEDSGSPMRLVGTSYAIAKVFDKLDELELQFDLRDSMIIDTGGYKGLVRDRTREEFIRQARDRLNISPLNCLNEYGMSEMTSHFWSHWYDNLEADFSQEFEAGVYTGREEWWEVPPWVKVRIVDPMTLEDDPNGVVAFYDLANVWSASALLTEDLGEVKELNDGSCLFRPLGRATGAELKGCSLAAERAMEVFE